MIQLVRHQFSRKRGSCMSMDSYHGKDENASEERDLMEIIRDNQLDELCVTKPKSPLDEHLEDLRLKCDTLMAVSSKKKVCTDKNFILSYREAEKQVASIKADALQKLLQSSKQNIGNGTSSAPFIVNRGKFFHKMNNDQKDAGRYMLDMLDKETHNNQLLMLLHGPPGTGKSFLIKRLQECTNIEMRITATSGIAATSLNGTTIDWLLCSGRGERKKSKVEIVRERLGDATLLIVDEVSMLGCKKLLDMDSVLQKVRKVPAPFGGLDVIFVGDYAQIAPVRQLSIMDAMVNTTLAYTQPAEYAIKTTALMRQFRKFELREFCRSQNCSLLSSILTKFRRTESKKDSLSMKDIRDIGLASPNTFVSDSRFRDAPFLVATRKERDALTLRAGKIWAKQHGIPLYWW